MDQYDTHGSFGTNINALRNNQQGPVNAEFEPNIDYQNNINNINPNISKLVYDINKSLDDYAPTVAHTESETDEEYIKEDKNDKWYSSIPLWVKEIMLFVAIYFIFSMGTIKQSIGTYVKYINPDEDGNVSFIGIIIYGLILISVFMVSKYFLLK